MVSSYKLGKSNDYKWKVMMTWTNTSHSHVVPKRSQRTQQGFNFNKFFFILIYIKKIITQQVKRKIDGKTSYTIMEYSTNCHIISSMKRPQTNGSKEKWLYEFLSPLGL